jgi:hypothetical protein
MTYDHDLNLDLDHDVDLDIDAHLDYERDRRRELAYDEINRVSSSLPSSVVAQAADELVESYGCDVGDPDFDDEEDVVQHVDFVEFFRRDPHEVVVNARKAWLREIVTSAQGPASARPIAYSRGSSRAPRRVIRGIRRRAATAARSPGRPGDDDPPPLARSRRLLEGVAA